MDRTLFHLIHDLAGKSALLDWLGIFLANYFAYVIVLVIIILLILEKDWRQRFYFFFWATLSVILSRGVVVEVIRFFYYRPRPFLLLNFEPLLNHDQTGSFPSGHAAAYFALAMVVYYFFKEGRVKFSRGLEWWFFGAVALMTMARVFVGVHWPLDVLGGAAVGISSAVLIRKILPLPAAPGGSAGK